MKKFKLSFLMMAIFILLLTACSGGQEAGGGKEEPVKDDEAEKVEEVEEAEEVEDEVTYDLGGRVIKISNHWDMTPEGGTEIGDLAVERWKEVEEKYNVKIEFTVVTWEEKINQFTSYNPSWRTYG